EIAEEQRKKRFVTAENLHERWSEMFNADIKDICESTGKLKPIALWPKVWRQMLSGLDVKELYERSKDGGDKSWDVIGQIIKVKTVSVKDLGELLGKHKAWDALINA